MTKIKETSHQQQFINWCERHNFYTSHSEYDATKDTYYWCTPDFIIEAKNNSRKLKKEAKQ